MMREKRNKINMKQERKKKEQEMGYKENGRIGEREKEYARKRRVENNDERKENREENTRKGGWGKQKMGGQEVGKTG